jgi:hypothetical protein
MFDTDSASTSEALTTNIYSGEAGADFTKLSFGQVHIFLKLRIKFHSKITDKNLYHSYGRKSCINWRQKAT